MKFVTAGLLAAFDTLGHSALAAGQRLENAVYGGSALMLAGIFQFSTEDLEIAAIQTSWPERLAQAVADIALAYHR